VTPSVVSTVAEMSAWSEEVRARGERIAFVPTMGALHAGHVALLHAAREHLPRDTGRVVLSVFVNPTQFGPAEDLARYPRDLQGDLAIAAPAGIDAVFAPTPVEMYPPHHQTTVRVAELEQGMCGATRPGHFVGVATVVCKLFNIIRPHVAIFGEKDFQQLAVIRRMVVDLNMPVQVVGMPTVREPDGLAMSSRNRYLDPDQRERALSLSRALFATRARSAAGERDVASLLAGAQALLAGVVDRLEYLELRDAETLAPLTSMGERPAVLAVAAFIGKTRLIDNVRLGPAAAEPR
jgi:pantoate--beta-alanine ligase